MKPAAAALLCLGLLLLGFPSLATAEPYFALYGGLALTADQDIDIFQDVVDASGSTLATLDGSLKGVEFDRSPVFGLKLGYFFPRRLLGGNLGFEYEVYYFRPDIDRQIIEFSGTAPCPDPCELGKADVSVIAAGLSVVYRVPMARSRRFPRGQLQPYVGLGGGAFIARFESTSILDEGMDIDDTDVRPGLQAFAGLRLFLTRNIAFFGEYKFIHAGEFEFDLKATGTFFTMPATEATSLRYSLTGHHFNAGISLHF